MGMKRVEHPREQGSRLLREGPEDKLLEGSGRKVVVVLLLLVEVVGLGRGGLNGDAMQWLHIFEKNGCFVMRRD